MRFSAPRSLSPSPVRRQSRKSSTFGLQSGSDTDSYDSDSDLDSNTDSESTASSSSDSFCYASESEVPPPPLLKLSTRTPTEQRRIEDTVAAIRLRTRHHDPYEEWEKQTRKDAFRTARQEQSIKQSQLHVERDQAHRRDSQRLATLHAQQVAEVQARLDAFKRQQQVDEKKLKDTWKARDRILRERIETVIRLEEEKVRARLEAERKVKDEEEKKRREEELKQRLAEEKRKQEEERKKKEEEDVQRQKEEQRKKEAEEERQRLKEETVKTARLQEEKEQRKSAGLTTAEDDWQEARANLQRLKSDSMKIVKSNRQLKSTWGTCRRQITPKIGQLTNDRDAITRISIQLFNIVRPPSGPPHEPPVYMAILSSLTKAILLQAETEVTAEKRSAGPLAQVTFNLLESLEHFPEVFFAKLVQRVGGWPIPVVVPSADYDHRPWTDEVERVKAMGYRKGSDGADTETVAEYSARVAGIMRVYFHILKIPPGQHALKPMFQLPRYWIWFARMMGEPGLLQTAVAPQIIYTALDVCGSDAKDIWGHQWIKMLALLYEGVTVGLGGDTFIGGQSPEGKAARVRVQLEVERIMSGLR